MYKANGKIEEGSRERGRRPKAVGPSEETEKLPFSRKKVPFQSPAHPALFWFRRPWVLESKNKLQFILQLLKVCVILC